MSQVRVQLSRRAQKQVKEIQGWWRRYRPAARGQGPDLG